MPASMPTWAKLTRLQKAGSRRDSEPDSFQAKAGEGVEDDPGKGVKIADDVAEDADIERFFDQAAMMSSSCPRPRTTPQA